MSFVVSSSGGAEGGGDTADKVFKGVSTFVEWTAPGFIHKINAQFGSGASAGANMVMKIVVAVWLL